MLGRHPCRHAADGAGQGAVPQCRLVGDPITEPGNPWTFRIMPNEVMQGVDIATNAYRRLNARTAVLLYENTNAGIGNAKVFSDTFTRLGGKILADIGFGRDINDFTASRRESQASARLTSFRPTRSKARD